MSFTTLREGLSQRSSSSSKAIKGEHKWKGLRLSDYKLVQLKIKDQKTGKPALHGRSFHIG